MVAELAYKRAKCSVGQSSDVNLGARIQRQKLVKYIRAEKETCKSVSMREQGKPNQKIPWQCALKVLGKQKYPVKCFKTVC